MYARPNSYKDIVKSKTAKSLIQDFNNKLNNDRVGFASVKSRADDIPEELFFDVFDDNYINTVVKYIGGATRFKNLEPMRMQLNALYKRATNGYKIIDNSADRKYIEEWFKHTFNPNNLSRIEKILMGAKNLAGTYVIAAKATVVIKQSITPIFTTILDKTPPKFTKSKFLEKANLKAKDLPFVDGRVADPDMLTLKDSWANVFYKPISGYDKFLFVSTLKRYLDRELKNVEKFGFKFDNDIQEALLEYGRDQVEL
jgi:hypothetical protein